jgi:hypothetical protein
MRLYRAQARSQSTIFILLHATTHILFI